MSAVNNIYLAAGEPFARYVKTMPSKLAGIRLDPMHQDPRPVSFVLESGPEGFSYDSEVLCIYSEREDTYLRQANKVFFQQGMLKPYDETEADSIIAVDNTMSDEDIKSIASIKSLSVLKRRLAEITSYFTLSRIVSAAEDLGAKKTHMDLMKARQAELAL